VKSIPNKILYTEEIQVVRRTDFLYDEEFCWFEFCI